MSFPSFTCRSRSPREIGPTLDLVVVLTHHYPEPKEDLYRLKLRVVKTGSDKNRLKHVYIISLFRRYTGHLHLRFHSGKDFLQVEE